MFILLINLGVLKTYQLSTISPVSLPSKDLTPSASNPLPMTLIPLTEAKSIQEQPSILTPTESMPPMDTLASVVEPEADLTSSFISNYYYFLFDSKSYTVVLYT